MDLVRQRMCLEKLVCNKYMIVAVVVIFMLQNIVIFMQSGPNYNTPTVRLHNVGNFSEYYYELYGIDKSSIK